MPFQSELTEVEYGQSSFDNTENIHHEAEHEKKKFGEHLNTKILVQQL